MSGWVHDLLEMKLCPLRCRCIRCFLGCQFIVLTIGFNMIRLIVWISFICKLPILTISPKYFEFSSDTCKLNNVFIFILTRMGLTVLFAIGCKNENATYMLPFICFFYGTQVFTIPYNVYCFYTKLDDTSNDPVVTPTYTLHSLILMLITSMCAVSMLIEYQKTVEYKYLVAVLAHCEDRATESMPVSMHM